MIKPSVREMTAPKPQSAAVQFLHKPDHFHMRRFAKLHYYADSDEFKGCRCRIHESERVNGPGGTKRIDMGIFYFPSVYPCRKVNVLHWQRSRGPGKHFPSSQRCDNAWGSM